ncbi:MAG: hypothetical protein HQ522_05270 [Bacteroidetes bacterium]|nr:hypothetical protein [Bacteroidota bacterium]
MSYKTTKAENKLSTVLSLPLGEKTVVWLSEVNKYIVVIPPVDKIIKFIYQGESEKSILEYCVDTLKLSMDEANQTIQLVKNNLSKIESQKDISGNKIHSKFKIPTFDCKRFYQINEIVFFIEYETPEIEYLVHPKFAHLEIPETAKFNTHLQLFQIETEIVLLVNGETIGSWPNTMEHFMTGKVSMEILQKIYHNEEKNWMAVFHAAGISNGRESIMFLGDSGNGKSTLSAILLASGFDILADDFLPVESETLKLCSFPAAISVKKHAIDLLATNFPELKNSKEYSYPLFNKTVRYLSNPNSVKGAPKKVPCKALVFVKYEVNSELQFSSLAKDIAFQKLVPDSWISPLEKNARQFLNWFGKLPCYQLTYSNNEAMVETVNRIFNDEL